MSSMITDAEIEARVKVMAEALGCFTERDVMFMTGLRREGLVRMRNAGKLAPSVVMGRTLLFPIPAFRQWLADNMDKPHPKSRKRQKGVE